MEGFCFVTPITGLNRPNTGKEDDYDDIECVKLHIAICQLRSFRTPDVPHTGYTLKSCTEFDGDVTSDMCAHSRECLNGLS
jgi:hypothetical protein